MLGTYNFTLFSTLLSSTKENYMNLIFFSWIRQAVNLLVDQFDLLEVCSYVLLS